MMDIVEVRPLERHRLFIVFADGTRGEVDVAKLVPFDGVFAPLKDPEVFAQVRVNPEIGTVAWPNGADLDPDVLFGLVSGRPIAPVDDLP